MKHSEVKGNNKTANVSTKTRKYEFVREELIQLGEEVGNEWRTVSVHTQTVDGLWGKLKTELNRFVQSQ